MTENNLLVSDEEICSELYLDALDKEKISQIIVPESDDDEIQEFRSSLCFWDDVVPPSQLGVYHQMIEARIVVKSHCPKCYLNLKQHEGSESARKLDGQVLDYQKKTREESKVCPICFRRTDRCTCEELLTKPINSYNRKKKWNNANKTRPKMQKYNCSSPITRSEKKDIISLLEKKSRIPIPLRNQNRFDTSVPTKMNTCKVPLKCHFATLPNKFDKNSSPLCRFSDFSSKKVQIAHSVTRSKFTEILRKERCPFCNQNRGCCICRNSKHEITGKCDVCGKAVIACLCDAQRPSRLRCICEQTDSKIRESDRQREIIKTNSKLTSSVCNMKSIGDTKSSSENKYNKTINNNNKYNATYSRLNNTNGNGQKPFGGSLQTTFSSKVRGNQFEQQKNQQGLDKNTANKKRKNNDKNRPKQGFRRTSVAMKSDETKTINLRDFPKKNEESHVRSTDGNDQKNMISDVREGSEEIISELKRPETPDKSVDTNIAKYDEEPIARRETKKVTVLIDPSVAYYEKMTEQRETMGYPKKVGPDITKTVDILEKKESSENDEILANRDELQEMSHFTKDHSDLPKLYKTIGTTSDDDSSRKALSSWERLANTDDQNSGNERRNGWAIPRKKLLTKEKNDTIQKLSEDQKGEEKPKNDVDISDQNNSSTGNIKELLTEEKNDEFPIEGKQINDVDISDQNISSTDNKKQEADFCSLEIHKQLEKNTELFEPTERNSRNCKCLEKYLPLKNSMNSKLCEISCKQYSKIPRPTYKYPKKRTGCNCCHNSTNTDQNVMIEIGMQCHIRNNRGEKLCNNCKLTQEPVGIGLSSVNNDLQMAMTKIRTHVGLRRSATFVYPENTREKFRNNCQKLYQRPSTASKIESIKKGCELNKQSLKDSFLSAEKANIQMCQPCAESLHLNSERSRSKMKSSSKNSCNCNTVHCHVIVNTEQKKLSSSTFQCIGIPSPSRAHKSKQGRQSRTGGTFVQDIISSYITSGTSRPESPPPHQFLIQTLLSQFTGYELVKTTTASARGRSIDRSRSPQQVHFENAMRSIQIQAGATSAPKCEAVQTVTTFMMTSPCVFTESKAIAEKKMNYVCGPDVPGLRTRVAMNLNEVPLVEQKSSCICTPICHIQHMESPDTYESSNCSYYGKENTKINCKITKKNKFVFITVTPVQTDPCEQNCFIMMKSSSEKQSDNRKETKCKKLPKCSRSSSSKGKREKDSSARKDPVDLFKNEIFSTETLKSTELIEMLGKKGDVVQNAALISTVYNRINPLCVASLLDRVEHKVPNSPKEEEITSEEQDCGPDNCKFVKCPQQKREDRCFDNQVVTTNTIACGCDFFIHQNEDNGLNTENIHKASKPLIEKVTEAICGHDTCGFMQQTDPTTNNMNQISIQTNELCKQSIFDVISSKAISIMIPCDACTETDEEKETTFQFCDEGIGTIECERMNTFCQTCHEEKDVEMNVATTVLYHYCDASCDAEIEEKATEDRESCTSSCEPDTCSYNQENRENHSDVPNVCDHHVCPEKITKYSEYTCLDAENRSVEDCRDPICSKHLTTKMLDNLDVIKLKLAMDRFIQRNPNSNPVNDD